MSVYTAALHKYPDSATTGRSRGARDFSAGEPASGSFPASHPDRASARPGHQESLATGCYLVGWSVAAAAASNPVPPRAGAEREATGDSGAEGANRATGAGHSSRRDRRVRGRARPDPAAPHQLSAAAQARPGHRHAAPPALRRRTARSHRGHPRVARDREDPDPPGAGSATTAQGPGARGGGRASLPEPRRSSGNTSPRAEPPNRNRADTARRVSATLSKPGATLRPRSAQDLPNQHKATAPAPDPSTSARRKAGPKAVSGHAEDT